MKKFTIISLIFLAILSCNKSEDNLKDNHSNKIHFTPELIGDMHNDILDYIFNNAESCQTRSSDDHDIIPEAMTLCDEYLVDHGYPACFSNDTISDAFVTEEMRYSVEAWNYIETYELIPPHRKYYMDKLKNMSPTSMSHAFQIANSVALEIRADKSLSSEDEEGLLIATSTFKSSLEYWYEKATTNIETRGLWDRFTDWFEENSDIIMADCTWAQNAFFATAASANPFIWGTATVGGAVVGSLAAEYI